MEQFTNKPRKTNKNYGGGIKQTHQSQYHRQQHRYSNHIPHNPNYIHQHQRGGGNPYNNPRFPYSPFLTHAAIIPDDRQQRKSNVTSAPKQKQLDEQELLCPKCTRFYQVTKPDQQFGYNLHGPSYSSLPGPYSHNTQQHILRLPYVLPCDHVICGDCIRSAHAQRAVKCPECDVCAAIDIDKEPDKSFAINYYLVGRIFLQRHLSSAAVGNSMPQYYPAGGESVPHFVRANNAPFMQMQGSDPNSLMMQDLAIDPATVLSPRCSMKPCTAPATLNCLNCKSIFCAACSNVLHGGEIAGLTDHCTRPLQPQLLAACPQHTANVLDFHCVNCDVDLCCYCFIEGGHAAHEHTRLTVLNEDQKLEFKELMTNVEGKLKKLEDVYKVTDQHITASINSGQQALSGESKQHQQLVSSINKHFADLMAKLLNTHHRLRQKLDMAQYASVTNLRSIQSDVAQRLTAGRSLLSQGLLVLDSSNPSKSSAAIFNVAMLRQELEQMLEWPSCLVDGRHDGDKTTGHIEFISDLSENMDKFCALKVLDADQFQLVHEGRIPDGYTIAKLPEILQHDYPDSSSQSSYMSNVSSTASISRQSDFNNRLSRPPSALSVAKMIPPKQNANAIGTPTVGSRMAVTVVHINTPDSIYVQLIENLPILKAIHNDLANYVKRLSTSEVSDPKIGEFYIVKQSIHWVRARCIKSSKRADFYIMQLLETGQIIEVHKLHMRECSMHFSQVPPMAYHCRLNNLYPYNQVWSSEAKKLLENILTLKGGYVSPFYPKHKIGEIESCNVSMQVYSRENSIYSVELIASREDLSTVLSNALIFTGLAKLIDTSNDELGIKTVDSIKIYENSSKIDVHQRMRISLVHVEDPYNIYVHLYNFHGHFKELIRNMNMYYLENNRGIIYTPRIGMYVSVIYAESESHNWYRGKIVNVINGIGKVDVLLIDFGKTVNVEYKNLRTLPVTFTMLECQAIHIHLADISPPPPNTPTPTPNRPLTWPEATMEFLREFMKNPGHHLEIAVTEHNTNPHLVVLFECLPLIHYCINAQLVEAGLATSTGRLSTSDHIAWPQGGTSLDGNSSDDTRMTSSSVRLIEGTPSFTLDLLKTVQGSDGVQIELDDDEDEDDEDGMVGGRMEVDVLMVKSPDEIYIKAKSRDPDVLQVEPTLMRQLQMHYVDGAGASARSADTTWQKGDNIVAHNNRTAQFHRGLIRQVLAEGNDGYIVLCRDRAIEFKADPSSIYALAEDFAQIPYLAKRVRLANIQPIGGKWSLLATDIITTMCSLEQLDSPDGRRLNQKYYYRRTGDAYIMDDGEISQPGILWVCNLISSGPLERSRYKYRSINKKLMHSGVAVSDTHNNPHIPRHAQRPLSTSSDSNKESRLDADCSPVRLLTPSHAAQAVLKAFEESSDVATLSVTGDDSSTSESDVGTMGIVGRRRMVGQCSSGSSKSSIQSTEELHISSYLPPLPLPERRFNAIATNVDETANVYLHPEQLVPVIATLDEHIQQAIKVFNQKVRSKKSNTFRVGELCTVRFHLDKKWYRGKITHAIPSNTAGGSALEYRVQMVDYGNVEQVKQSELCDLVLCPNVPIIATKVRMHQIEPKCGPWNTSVLDSIHSLIVSKALEVHLCDKTNTSLAIPDAIIRLIDGVNLNEYLIQEFDCLCRGKGNVSDESDEDVVIIEESEPSPIASPVQEPKAVFNADDLKLFPDLEVGDKRLVKVIDVLNINVVTVEMQPDNISSLKSKYQEVFSSFNNSDIEHEPLNDIRDGVHCLSRYSVDNQYYRAEIMSILPPTTSSMDASNVSVHVFYLDYGNREIVPRGHLRSLSPYDPLVRRLPALARMVALHCVRPLPRSPMRAQLQDTALDSLMELLQQKDVVMEIVRNDPKLSVNLLQPMTDKLVYDGLITDGIVMRVDNDDSDDDYC